MSRDVRLRVDGRGTVVRKVWGRTEGRKGAPRRAPQNELSLGANQPHQGQASNTAGQKVPVQHGGIVVRCSYMFQRDRGGSAWEGQILHDKQGQVTV